MIRKHYVLFYLGASQLDHYENAIEMTRNAGLSIAKEFYGGEADYESIQYYLDCEYGGPGKIRLVVFSHAHQNRIIYKGCMNNSERKAADFNLCLYLQNRHFSFLGDPKSLFKVNTPAIFNFKKIYKYYMIN